MHDPVELLQNLYFKLPICWQRNITKVTVSGEQQCIKQDKVILIWSGQRWKFCICLSSDRGQIFPVGILFYIHSQNTFFRYKHGHQYTLCNKSLCWRQMKWQTYLRIQQVQPIDRTTLASTEFKVNSLSGIKQQMVPESKQELGTMPWPMLCFSSIVI